MNFDGGTLTAAYGNLIQTLNVEGLTNFCNPSTINVSVPSATVVRTIGGASSQRAAYAYTKKQYNKRNSSLAAAGQPIRVVTTVGEYTARLTGSIESFADYLCDNQNLIYDTVSFFSGRGAQYGPFNASSV